jgi:hypothetical protein
MSVFQLPAQIRTVAQSYFFLEVTTSVVTTSDLDALSNFKGTGCLICKINLLMEILALPPILIIKNHSQRNGISGAGCLLLLYKQPPHYILRNSH